MFDDETKQLQQMIEQMGRLYEVLLILRREVEPRNPALYSVMTEGPADQIEELRSEMDEFVGLTSLRDNGHPKPAPAPPP
ncbi:MAG TPA: hypothetical protein VGK45_10830 [Thermoanaerobaculia bacterium]